MLNRRDKRRYLAIWLGDHSYDQRKLVEAISKRSSELFGQIATERAKIRFIDIDDNTTIYKNTTQITLKVEDNPPPEKLFEIIDF